MAKTYKKDGEGLKEIETQSSENTFKLKDLKERKKFHLEEKANQQAIIDELQLLIDKCTELNIKE